jgi:hypothetical protein
MSEGNKKGGRPRKYLDRKDAEAAVYLTKKTSRRRRRQQAQQPSSSSELQIQLDPLSALIRAAPKCRRHHPASNSNSIIQQQQQQQQQQQEEEGEEEEVEEEEEEILVVPVEEELDAPDNLEKAIPLQDPEVVILLSFLTSVPDSRLTLYSLI